MSGSKLTVAALLVLALLNRPALAQQPSPATVATGSYPTSPVDGTGSKNGSGYYAMYPGGVNYGLSGTFPNLGGYGYPGYGPGPQFGAHYQSPTSPDESTKKATSSTFAVPKPSFGLTNLSQTVRKVTNKPTRATRPTNPAPGPIRTMP